MDARHSLAASPQPPGVLARQFFFFERQNLELMSAFIFWHVLIVCIAVNTGCKRDEMAPVFELHNFRLQAQ
jgi:hypothetical protein